ncbi:MAG: hypothetical protein GY833_12575 [Aestuariibacter sp.]|nr:hypothetical protein [Aestuariibacter sp.]|tara:strand:+ start:109011 stop:109280 length:270 start_codon:yes stop_codon:yes gene_type:complete
MRITANAKDVQLSGWVRQLQKQIKQFNGDLNKDGDEQPSMEEQIIFVQQQYELLSLLYEVSLGYDNPDVVQRIIGVDADLISREATTKE